MYDEYQQYEDDEFAVENAKSSVDAAGLGSLAIFMAAASLGPAAARRGVRGAIRQLGKADEAAQSAVDTARAAARKKAPSIEGQALAKRVRQSVQSQSSLVDRVRQSAALEYQRSSGGAAVRERASFSSFLSSTGFEGASNLKRRSGQYDEWAEGKSLVERAKGIATSRGQREIVKNLASKVALETAAEFPVQYGLDRYMGVTTPPGEQPEGVVGEITNIASYAPTYAAYEVAGRAAMKAPQAAKAALKRLKGSMKGAPKLARETGKLHDRALSTLEDLRRRQAGFRDSYSSQIATSGRGPVDKLADIVASGRAFYKDMKSARSTRRSMTPQERALARASRGLKEDEGLSNASELFRTQGNEARGVPLQHMARRATSSEGMEGLKAVLGGVFAKEGEEASGAFSQLFGAKTATLGDLEGQVESLRKRVGIEKGADPAKAKTKQERMLRRQLKEMQEEIDSVKQGVEDFRSQVIKGANKAPDAEVRKFVDENIRAEKIRMRGYHKVGGEVMRAPQMSAIRKKAVQGLVRGTTIGRRLSVAQLFQAHTVGAVRPDVEEVRGKVALLGDKPTATFVGGEKAFAASSLSPDQVRRYDRGFAVSDKPGSSKSTFYGFDAASGQMEVMRDASGNVVGRGKRRLGSMGNSKLQSIAMRLSGAGATRQASVERRLKDARQKKKSGFSKLLDRMGIGTGDSRSFVQHAKDAIGSRTPRGLLSEGSSLFEHKPQTRVAEGGFDVAHAIGTMRQAAINATPVFARSEMLSESLSAMKRSDLGTGADLANDPNKAFEAARTLLRDMPDFQSARDYGISPSAPDAKKIVREVEREGLDALHNATGQPRAQKLRRFIFEQGLLGGAADGAGTSVRAIKDADGLIQDLAKSGKLSKGAAAEARAGLKHLELRVDTQDGLKTPYEDLLDSHGGTLGGSKLGRAAKLMQQDSYKDVLQDFGASRPRVDLEYHSRAYTSSSDFGSGAREADVIGVDSGLKSAGSLYASYGLDTMREAFSFIGLGWTPQSASEVGEEGFSILKELGFDTWKKRGKALLGASVAYRAADTGVDMALPDEAPLGEGLTPALASGVAGVRRAQAHAFDATGVTAAAQYMEGLMPKSSTSIPGAIAGAYLGGSSFRGSKVKGAIAGAAANRMLHTAVQDTPLEVLMPDLTQDSEEVDAIYSGEQWVESRKGRGFLLSTSSFSGGRIEQYRPNWYTRTRADIGSTEAMYGSDLEEALFKPLPLVDFAPGDLIDPQRMERKHYADRPYVTPSKPFEEVPILGPILGATAGKAYNALHPMASNEPMHTEDLLAEARSERGEPLYSSDPGGALSKGRGGIPSSPGVSAVSAIQPGASNRPTVMEGTERALVDEQFYRLAEAMGFQGFVAQQVAGGEGVFRDAIFPSAGRMTSIGRSMHDQNLGDMLGVGEAARRFYPFERNATRRGVPNQMADWMPGEDANVDYTRGDPYCLAPDTYIELDGLQVRAEEAFERVKSGEILEARTHRGRKRPVVGSKRRLVSEDLVTIRVSGMPWPLVVTEGHPIMVVWTEEDTRLTKTEWKLAGDLTEDDQVLMPAGPEADHLHLSERKQGQVEHSGVATEAILALFDVVPPSSPPAYYTHTLALEQSQPLEQAFGQDPKPDRRRYHDTLCRLRIQMQERGLPEDMIGMSPGALRPLVSELGELNQGSVLIDIDAQTLGLEREWPGRMSAREADTPVLKGVESAAMVLWRAFLAAKTPAQLKQLGPGQWRLVLTGPSAARYLYSEKERYAHKDDQVWGEPLIRKGRPKHGKWRHTCGIGEIESITREHYEGYVYAFEVEEDSSFVAGPGVATHNSKVKMGEMVLPGAGYETVKGGVERGKELEIRDIGETVRETEMRMLDIVVDEESKRGQWAREQVQQLLQDAGYAAKEGVVYADASSKLTGQATMATQGNKPIMVESVSEGEFQSSTSSARHTEQLNALLGTSGRRSGSLVYVSEDTGQVKSFKQEFDPTMYNRTVEKLEQASASAQEASAEGYGAQGAMYSTLDRLEVLMNADPFGDKYQTEERRAEALMEAGAFNSGESERYRKLQRRREKMSIPFEVFPDRFSGQELLDPDSRVMMSNFNEHIKAADEYSLPERTVGAVWQKMTNMRSPLHTKFFGNPTVEQAYEDRVLLGRDFQNWANPYQDFVKPYAQGLRAADDPAQGAASFGLGAGLLLGGPYKALGATAGAVYGAAHGAYRKMTGTQYVPNEVQQTRDTEQAFDRLKFYRARSLYRSTGSSQYQMEAERTAYSVARQGFSREGFGQRSRQSQNPSDQGLGPDRGFGSPWRGLDDIVRQVWKMNSEIPQELMENYADKRARQAVKRGLSEKGMAKRMRSKNTRTQTGRGFASPYQGQDPGASLAYQADQPGGYAQPFEVPGEMLSVFSAAPKSERDFVKLGLAMQDPEEQRQFAQMVSSDMAAVMDQSWQYLYDSEPLELQVDPRREMNLPASHPAMALGADLEGHQIRTMEDLGLAPKDAGIGWKDAMLRMESSMVEPTSLASEMRGQGQQVQEASAEEMKAIIKGALAQMGVRVSVEVHDTSAPTSIEIHQTA